MQTEVKIAEAKDAHDAGILEWGEPSLFACPECHGVLKQIMEGNQMRFRCHTGHAYSLETLLAEFEEQNEEALWNAIRSMEETSMLSHQMAGILHKHGHKDAATKLQDHASAAQRKSKLVRRAVLEAGTTVVP